jgi:hypothetical protein
MTLSPKQCAFLEAFGVTATIAAASKAARVGRNQHRQWLKSDPTYVAAFQDATEEAADNLEAEAYRRALRGVRKPVMHGGKQCEIEDPDHPGKMIKLWEHQYSDILAIFLLKGLRPAKYGDKLEQRLHTDTAPTSMRHFGEAIQRQDKEFHQLIEKAADLFDPNAMAKTLPTPAESTEPTEVEEAAA